MTLADYYLQKLEKSPSYSNIQINGWADYIEFLCLANIDNEISKADLIDRLSGRSKDLREDTEEYLDEYKKMEDEETPGYLTSRRAEISDRWETRASDYFKILLMRQSLYGELYPFVVESERISRRASLTESHHIYIFLLMCSNLYLFDNKTRQLLAGEFELVCLNVFRNLLPTRAVVHLFGKNPHNKKGRFSTGTFWQKLKRLTSDINELRNPHLKKHEFSEHNTGDEGLDIVGWIPTQDKLASALIFFAQCACTYDFVGKQHSSSATAWFQKLIFKNPPSNTTFIPHCYRKADGSWMKPSNIMFTFLVDRRRILTYYQDSDEVKFSNLKLIRVVNDIILAKEGVI